jgi:hypothetical protein
MRNKWVKRLFPYFAFLLLIPWPVAYAFDDAGGQTRIQIEIADESAKPGLTTFGKAIGSVESGELFYIDASGNSADIVATLYLANPQELIKHYSYFILKVVVYVQTDGEWEKAIGSNGSLISDAVLSMKTGQVSFALPGYANYLVGIDGGAFYGTKAGTKGSSLSPQFFLEAN